MTAAARSGALLCLREGGIELTGPDLGQPDDLRRKIIHAIGVILLELGGIAAADLVVGGITRDLEDDPPVALTLRLDFRFRLLRPLPLARGLAFDRAPLAPSSFNLLGDTLRLLLRYQAQDRFDEAQAVVDHEAPPGVLRGNASKFEHYSKATRRQTCRSSIARCLRLVFLDPAGALQLDHAAYHQLLDLTNPS